MQRATKDTAAKVKDAACDDVCMVEAAGMHALARRAYRPHMPGAWATKPDTWLTNVDIEAVMRQYQERYTKDFVWLGVHPVDFAARSNNKTVGRCVSVCHETIVSALENKRRRSRSAKVSTNRLRYAMVLNLDAHTEPGSHWVAVFGQVGLDDGGSYYFDSIARPPPAPIAALLRDMVAFHGGKVRHNRHRVQYENQECGVYVIYFLAACLEATEDGSLLRPDAFDALCRRLPGDDVMARQRSVFFSRPHPL
jgi:hypothetical protein